MIIKISGKKNIDSLKKFNNIEVDKEDRKVLKKWSNKDYILDPDKQISITNQLFLNEDFPGKKDVIREIRSKLNSYKNQDLKKKKFDDKQFITFDDTIEKIVTSKLRCYYCKKSIKLIFNEKRDPNQWTLDRLDNNLGHTKDNTVIADLECNLKRRRQDDNKFLFSKQVKVILVE